MSFIRSRKWLDVVLIRRSPLTLLRTRTMFGRPDFKQIFQSLTASIDGGSYLVGREATLKTRLGVYYCGVSLLLLLLLLFASSSQFDQCILIATTRTCADLPAVQPNALARVIKTEAMKCKSDTIDVKFAKEHF